MKIAIIAASGRLGQVVTRAAIDAAHDVVAFVRSPEKLGPLAEEVTVVQGDIGDPESLERAIEEVDAVLWCAGPGRGGSKPDVFGRGMRNVVAAMERHDVRRVVAVSGAAMPMAGDERTLSLRIMRGVMRLMPIPIVACNAAQRDALVDSDRDWVIVRSMNMTDGEARGRVQASATRYPGGTITRESLAAFMIEQLSSDEWLGKAPMVASG